MRQAFQALEGYLFSTLPEALASLAQAHSLMEKAKAEVDEEMARTAAKIKADVAAARGALKPQAESFALDLAAKILGREMA